MSERSFITCRQLIAVIGIHLEGELDAAGQSELERHLIRCPSCRAYLASYRETIVLARSCSRTTVDDVPDELVETILRAALG